MNKLFAVLFVSALVAPAFAVADTAKPTDKTPAKVATQKVDHPRKTASMKKPAAQNKTAPTSRSIASLRDSLDAPWVLPA